METSIFSTEQWCFRLFNAPVKYLADKTGNALISFGCGRGCSIGCRKSGSNTMISSFFVLRCGRLLKRCETLLVDANVETGRKALFPNVQKRLSSHRSNASATVWPRRLQQRPKPLSVGRRLILQLASLVAASSSERPPSRCSTTMRFRS